MKKYIRTKDGKIFEIEKDLGKYGISKAVIICDFNGNFIDIRKQNMILKQAGTIEELCDVFVYKNKIVELDIDKNEPEYSCILVEIDDDTIFYTRTLIYLNDLEETLFGAIWTDKGLIYKAKMKGVLPNGKIDWELL